MCPLKALPSEIRAGSPKELCSTVAGRFVGFASEVVAAATAATADDPAPPNGTVAVDQTIPRGWFKTNRCNFPSRVWAYGASSR